MRYRNSVAIVTRVFEQLKMGTFRNCHHDFPRLAKESGYFFQLYRGRVNWPDIENLSIDDIIDNKNFEMLEKNLINVINCNLEREYDLKVLDRNFVKLFKLAQLGVDYLSYCELYLDRCVVLLQEQLIALQEEYELLKQEYEKSSEELRKFKKKSRIQSYQCEKCDKVFINDVYLKHHEKRRHCSSKACKSSQESAKTFIDRYQQTETEENQALDSSQSFLLEKGKSVKKAIENDVVEMVNKENKIKIELLEKELQEVKSRLKKAESTLTMKCEAPISSVPQPLSFPNPRLAPDSGSIFYPPTLQWIPSYLPQQRINFINYAQGSESLVSNNEPRENCHVNDLGNSRIVSSKFFFDEEPNLGSGSKDNLPGKTSNGKVKNDSFSTLRETNFLHRNSVPARDSKKENIDPSIEKVFPNLEKPRLLPRKIETLSESKIEEETLLDKTPLEQFQMTTEKFKRYWISNSFTPMKENHETRMKENISEELKEYRPEGSSERIPKSLFRKIFVKKSPKLQELSKNWRTSLTSLYDSVSYSGKELRNTKEFSRNSVMDGLHGELRKLGIDPEWSGIPKNTVRQKLKILKHRRKLMTKENPLYPIVRKGIERNILNKLDNSTNSSAKKNVKGESKEQESIEVKSLDTRCNVTELTCYDEMESESESDFVDNSEATRGIICEQKGELEKGVISNVDSTVEKEFDFSIFQVNKERDLKQSVTRDHLFGVNKDPEIVSDLDSQRSDDVDNYNSYVIESGLRNGEENISDNVRKNKWEFSEKKHQNIPKSTLRSLLKSQAIGLKKKVVFKNLSENKEDETTKMVNKSSSTWQSIKSEDAWASKNNGESCDETAGGVG